MNINTSTTRTSTTARDIVTTVRTRSLAALVAAAEKINAYAQPMTLSGARRGSRSLALASVWAAVHDDLGGPLVASDTPVGEPRLIVDIERFRERADTHAAAGRAKAAAEDRAVERILGRCERLGFSVVFERSAGSGKFGSIDSLFLA